MKIEDKQNIPQSQGFILLLDQGDLLKCLALEAAISNKKIYWAVQRLENKHPIFRWLLLKLGCFSLDTTVLDIQGFRLLFQALKKKGIVTFYPTTLTKGIALFCLRSGEDILPAVVLRQNKRPHFKVFFGPIYNFREYQNAMVNIEIVEGIIQQIKDSMERLTS